MCKNKLQKSIEEEKNIDIRIRHEEKIKYNLAIVLAILFAGGFVTGKESVSGVILGVILTLIVLGVYYFFHFIYLTEFAEYTDHLIREKAKNISKK